MEEGRIYGSQDTYFKIMELDMVVYFLKNATFEKVISFVGESKSAS